MQCKLLLLCRSRMFCKVYMKQLNIAKLVMSQPLIVCKLCVKTLNRGRKILFNVFMCVEIVDSQVLFT